MCLDSFAVALQTCCKIAIPICIRSENPEAISARRKAVSPNLLMGMQGLAEYVLASCTGHLNVKGRGWSGFEWSLGAHAEGAPSSHYSHSRQDLRLHNLEVISTACTSLANSLMAMQGAAEYVLANCTRYMNEAGEVVELGSQVREELQAAITAMADRGLRTLCLAYRDMPDAPPSQQTG